MSSDAQVGASCRAAGLKGPTGLGGVTHPNLIFSVNVWRGGEGCVVSSSDSAKM